jgi:purine-binding chemotaxis protein CheW
VISMEEKTEQKNYAERQLVIFSLGNEEFGVDISEVREIIKLEEITFIQDTENYIDGVINLRGKIIVVLNLAKRLNIPSGNRNKDTRIIVVVAGSNTIGMVVDGCNEVIRLNTSQIEPAPEIVKKKINQEYLEGVGILNDRLIILLDLARVIDKKEFEKLSEISNK